MPIVATGPYEPPDRSRIPSAPTTIPGKRGTKEIVGLGAGIEHFQAFWLFQNVVGASSAAVRT
jgi:hypothetical protein